MKLTRPNSEDPGPKAVAASLDVKAGEAVELTIEGSAVVIRSRRPKYSIEELVAAMRTEAEPESFDALPHTPLRPKDRAIGSCPVLRQERIKRRTNAANQIQNGAEDIEGQGVDAGKVVREHELQPLIPNSAASFAWNSMTIASVACPTIFKRRLLRSTDRT